MSLRRFDIADFVHFEHGEVLACDVRERCPNVPIDITRNPRQVTCHRCMPVAERLLNEVEDVLRMLWPACGRCALDTLTCGPMVLSCCKAHGVDVAAPFAGLGWTVRMCGHIGIGPTPEAAMVALDQALAGGG